MRDHYFTATRIVGAGGDALKAQGGVLYESAELASRSVSSQQEEALRLGEQAMVLERTGAALVPLTAEPWPGTQIEVALVGREVRHGWPLLDEVLLTRALEEKLAAPFRSYLGLESEERSRTFWRKVPKPGHPGEVIEEQITTLERETGPPEPEGTPWNDPRSAVNPVKGESIHVGPEGSESIEVPGDPVRCLRATYLADLETRAFSHRVRGVVWIVPGLGTVREERTVDVVVRPLRNIPGEGRADREKETFTSHIVRTLALRSEGLDARR